jgi:hypothetical protein
MIYRTPRLSGKSACLSVAIALVCILAISPVLLHAQTTMGDITGTVLDPTGASVPGALITVKNAGTSGVRTTTTDASGAFRVVGLIVGNYAIEAEKAGFKRAVQTGLVVRPATVNSVTLRLDLSETVQTAEVTDVAPVTQNESAALTTGVPAEAYGELPLQNEAWNTYTFDPLTWVPGSAGGNTLYSFAGNRPSMSQANLEGMQHNMLNFSPPTTAIGEVSVLMSNAPAEYARPVTMDAQFKSGTNRLSGELMGDFQNPCANALSTPFSNPASRACTTQWYLFYSAGGPIYVPKIYDGRNKSFFFFTLNKNPATTQSGIPVIASVPSLNMQKGIFSNYSKSIIDPTTGTRFANNVIPASRISNVATNIVNQYYGTNYKYVGDSNSYIDNGSQTGSEFDKTHSYAMRFDHNLGSKDIFSGSYSATNLNLAQTLNISSADSYGDTRLNSAQAFTVAGHIFSFAETHVFSPAVVNEFRAGFTRTAQNLFTIPNDLDTSTPVMGNDVLSQWGLKGINGPNLSGSPSLTLVGWNYLSAANQYFDYDTRYQAYDNISFHVGKHTIKTGFSAVRLLEDMTANGDYFGNFTFNGLFTGESWSDLLLGLPSAFSDFTSRPTVAQRRWEFGAFVQDDYRLTSKLTLYYGLRWSHFTVPYDKNGLYYNYDPEANKIVVPNQKALDNVSSAWPTSVLPIETASAAGYPSKLLNGHNNWDPRFGFAYKIDSKTVLRGGYGIYTGAMRFNELQTTGPFAVTSSYVNQASSSSSTGAMYAFPNPFPAQSSTAQVVSVSGFAKNYRNPYSQNWNATFEREVVKDWGLQVTYRGVKSSQLIWQQNLNSVAASTTAWSQDRLPNPNLQTVLFNSNGANDRYEALMFQITHPFSKGLYVTAAYTRAWSYDEAEGNRNVLESDQTPATVEYSFDRARDGGRAAAFPTHDFVVNAVHELPFGRGRQFGRNLNPVVNAVLGGWAYAATFSYRSGTFFTPLLAGVDPGNIGSTTNRRPNVVPGCNVYANQSVHGQWFNPACFTTPAAGELGNAGVNSLEGPSAWVFSLNPYKEFPLSFIREGMRLRFGANIYNIFNHPVYGNPQNIVNAASAGVISQTTYARGAYNNYSGQRQFVFDARVSF